METLLKREVRAALPFAHQVWLYLDPSALFKDASRGPAWVRVQARRYNRSMRWILLAYIRRWLFIAIAFFSSIAPAEAIGGRETAFVVLAAALAVASCIAVAVSVYTAAAYLLLGAGEDGSSG